MNNELQVFSYEGNEIRTVQHNGEPWWVLKDVCDVLELSNPSMIADRLDDDERAKYCLGRQGDTNIISESGLYNVILLSRKSEAKKFKRWVTHEVLPTIRKHGANVTPAKLEEIMNDPDAWIKVLTALKQERAAKERLQLESIENKPKVVFADAVSVSDGTILIGELAKILKGNGIEIGQNRLFERSVRKAISSGAEARITMHQHKGQWNWVCSKLRKQPSPTRTVMSPSVKPPRLQAKASSISSTCS